MNFKIMNYYYSNHFSSDPETLNIDPLTINQFSNVFLILKTRVPQSYTPPSQFSKFLSLHFFWSQSAREHYKRLKIGI